MPKPKSLLKDSKAKNKRKTTQQAPVTADEFLAVGVEQEEAGEKWRAGDAAKSMRFFMRAIATYDDGLKKYPHAFDLAYNKARVQYEVTQHPKLAAQLPAPLADILNITLQSHREALNLDQDNMRYTEMQEQIKLMESGNVGPHEEEMQEQTMQESTEDAGESKPSDQQERWAAVIEPVTKDTLVDTAVAQLETLTTLCNLLTFNPGVGLGWVEESSADLLQEKISAYVEGSSRHYEASLARAKFTCALNEVLYRSGRIDVETYQTEITHVFGPDLNLSADPEGLCSKADALTSFNTAVTDLPPSNNHEVFTKSLMLRWQSLSVALDALTKASKLPDADNLPKIHVARGDIEMNRWRLGMPPWEYTMAQQNATVLLRNAQTYYRGAAALARRDGNADEERDGTCKEALAAALEGQKDKLQQLKATTFKELMVVAEDVVDDGWLSPGDMEALLS
ncbi:hypothetical protein BDV40DRAFT_228403 [Aspergillus tamarii]|uniref:Uncharacterized protein n=1 Tax=Aspergillus tamarii TaxID=41984 RepID=A0A5N6UMN6_ASPTM|nr:hypothetical protein BDV40DRAFT_228403 [Aspergillus tamarii]